MVKSIVQSIRRSFACMAVASLLVFMGPMAAITCNATGSSTSKTNTASTINARVSYSTASVSNAGIQNLVQTVAIKANGPTDPASFTVKTGDSITLQNQ